MKNRKFIFAFLILVILLPLLSVSVSASGELVVEKGLGSITYNGDKYVRVDSSTVHSVNYSDPIHNVVFSDSDDEAIVYANAFANDSAIELFVDYSAGGSGYYYYIRSDLIAEYEQAMVGDCKRVTLYLDFGSVELDTPSLCGEKLLIKGYELDAYPHTNGYVYPMCLDDTVTLRDRGYIVSTYEGEFFYVDQYQFGEYMNSDTLSLCQTLTVWRITDKDVIAQIKEYSHNEYFEDDDHGDELDMFIPGLVIFGVALGLLPLAGGIVALISSMKSKAPYKKYLRIVAILCLAAAAVTIATVILCVILA